LGGLLLASTAVYDTKALVSGYQLVDMPCIVVPVKFDGGLSISYLKKSNPSQKKRGQKFTFSKKFPFSTTFHTPPFGKRTDQSCQGSTSMIGVGNLPEKTQLPWYQSIAKKTPLDLCYI
jgi:hypothetical protein